MQKIFYNQIRDTQIRYTALHPGLPGGPSIYFFFINTTTKTINVTFQSYLDAAGTAGPFSTASVSVGGNSYVPFLFSHITSFVKLAIQATTAPTSGDFTVWT